MQRFHQARDGCGGSTGGQHVVDDEHVLAGRNRVLVDFEHVGAVFERVFDAFPLGRQFLLLADRDEAVSERVGDRGRDDEPARFDSEHHIDREWNDSARPASRSRP